MYDPVLAALEAMRVLRPTMGTYVKTMSTGYLEVVDLGVCEFACPTCHVKLPAQFTFKSHDFPDAGNMCVAACSHFGFEVLKEVGYEKQDS